MTWANIRAPPELTAGPAPGEFVGKLRVAAIRPPPTGKPGHYARMRWALSSGRGGPLLGNPQILRLLGGIGLWSGWGVIRRPYNELALGWRDLYQSTLSK